MGPLPRANRGPDRPCVIVVGCDEIGSAIAHTLHAAGMAVVLVDEVDPPWARRGMSYVDAWYVGGATLEHVDACFCGSVKSIPAVLARGDTIAATTWSWEGVASVLRPGAVIETRRDKPGSIREADAKLAARSRIEAPHPGRFRTRHEIAERVEVGDVIGELGHFAAVAPASGVLTALAARGARMSPGHLVAEIDAAGDPQRCYGVLPGARAIARRVAAAVRAQVHSPAAAPANPDTLNGFSGRGPRPLGECPLTTCRRS